MDKLTLIEYVDSIKNKKFTATDGIKFFCDKIKNDKHNAVLEFFPSALELAKKIDDKIARGEKLGRLAGAPIILKDNILYKGHTASAASKMLQNFTAPYSATVVEKIIAQDGIIIGRANMDEFAMGSSGEYSAYGATHNALKMGYVAGGSSSGSAVSVAAGLCMAALGSDTGGSIRCPAAYNGLYAMKPTYGTVSRYGLIAFASSLDQIGPICKTAQDTQLMLDVIHGKDKFDGTSIEIPETPVRPADPKNLRIGYVKEIWQHKEQIENFEKYQQIFEDYKKQGATIVDVSIKNLDLALPTYFIIAPAEAASNLSRFDGVKYTTAPENVKNIEELYQKTRTENFGDEVKRRIMLGNYVLSSGYFDAYYGKAKKLQAALKHDFARVFEQCDCLILPVTPGEAPKLGAIADAISMYLIDLFTVAANIVGSPALCVPFDTGTGGLPIAFQIMGKHFDEPFIFEMAKQYSTGGTK